MACREEFRLVSPTPSVREIRSTEMALTIRIPRRGKRVSVSLRPECPLVAEVFLAVLPVAVLPVAVSQAVHPVQLREEASRVELPAVDLRGAFDSSPRGLSQARTTRASAGCVDNRRRLCRFDFNGHFHFSGRRPFARRTT